MTKTVLTFRPIYFSRIFYSTYWNGKNSVLAHIWTFSKFWYNWMDFILHWSNMFQIKSTKVLIFHIDFDYKAIPKYVQRSMLVKFQFLMEILVWNFDRISGQLGQNFGFGRNWFQLIGHSLKWQNCTAEITFWGTFLGTYVALLGT